MKMLLRTSLVVLSLLTAAGCSSSNAGAKDSASLASDSATAVREGPRGGSQIHRRPACVERPAVPGKIPTDVTLGVVTCPFPICLATSDPAAEAAKSARLDRR